MNIRQISADKTIPIRHEVLRQGKPVESCSFTNDTQLSTFHFGAFFHSKLVGVCSVFKNEKQIEKRNFTHQLRGMAVLQNFQQKGVGKALLNHCQLLLTAHKIFGIWCNARTIATPFYLAHGFQVFGDEFDIPNIGKHYILFKKYA